MTSLTIKYHNYHYYHRFWVFFFQLKMIHDSYYLSRGTKKTSILLIETNAYWSVLLFGIEMSTYNV